MSSGRLIYEWLVDSYYSFAELVILNVLWFALTILLVTAPPAAAGLYHATNQMAHHQPANWRTFFEGFRAHFWMSWRWGLANLFVVVVLAGNFVFYGRVASGWASGAQGLSLGLLVAWVLLQLYTFPLLLEQTDRRLRTALRNSLVLWVRYPGFSLGLGLFGILLVALSTFLAPPAWIILTASLLAYLANRAVVYLVKQLHGGEPADA